MRDWKDKMLKENKEKWVYKKAVCRVKTGRDGGKLYIFFVCPCLYRKLGDLSTSLEMTVLDRVFSQGRTTFPGDSSGFFKPSEWQDCARDDGIGSVVFYGEQYENIVLSKWRQNKVKWVVKKRIFLVKTGEK